MWLAGAGVKKGFTHGATDEYGLKAVEGRMHVNDLHATLLALLPAVGAALLGVFFHRLVIGERGATAPR